jgi:hypothetical protein
LFAIDITERLINEDNTKRVWEDDLHRPWNVSKGKLTKEEWTTSVFAWKPPSLDARISAQNGGFIFGGVAGSTRPNKQPFQFPKGPKNESWSIAEGRSACCLALRAHKFNATRGAATSNLLYTFRIKSSAKSEIRTHLERLFGYKHSTIYPDYTGFSAFGTAHLKTR